jgi:hypothetical protein
MGLLDLSGINNLPDKIDVIIDVAARRSTWSGLVGADWRDLINPDSRPYNSSASYSVTSSEQSRIRGLGLRMLRICGLSAYRTNFGSLTGALDAAIYAAEQIGVPASGLVVCGTDYFGTTGLDASQWQSLVNYGKTRGIRYWEIENEPYNTEWRSIPQAVSRFSSVSDFVTYAIAAAQAIKNADPNAVVIAPIHGMSPNGSWGTALINSLSGYVDVFSGHWSNRANLHSIPINRVVLADPYMVALRILQVKNAATNKQIWDTSWAMQSPSNLPPDNYYQHKHNEPQFSRLNGNIVGVMARAAEWIYKVSEGLVGADIMLGITDRSQCEHNVESKGLLLVPTNASGVGYLYWLQRFLGSIGSGQVLQWYGGMPIGNVQDTEGTSRTVAMVPMVPVLHDGGVRLTVVMVNPQGASFPCKMTVVGFGINTASAVAIKGSSSDDPLLPDTSGTNALFSLDVEVDPRYVSFTVPPLSVVVLTLTRAGHYLFSGISTDQMVAISSNFQTGIGDLDDLKTDLVVDDSLFGVDRPQGYLRTHVGSYFFTPAEDYLHAAPVVEGFSLVSGINEVTLQYTPEGNVPIVVEDNRGRFLQINPSVVLMKRLSSMLSGDVWITPVDGVVLNVYNGKREKMYEVRSPEDLTTNSCYLSANRRQITTRTDDIYVDYVPDKQDILISEYVTSLDGTIVSRHVPEIDTAIAISVASEESYVPVQRQISKWIFSPPIPAGHYLIRYLRDRSFCVNGNRLTLFSKSPTDVRVTYSRSDYEYHDPRRPVDLSALARRPVIAAIHREHGYLSADGGSTPTTVDLITPGIATSPGSQVSVLAVVRDERGAGLSGWRVVWEASPQLLAEGEEIIKTTDDTGTARYYMSIPPTATASIPVMVKVHTSTREILASGLVPVNVTDNVRTVIVHAFRVQHDPNDIIYVSVIGSDGLARTSWDIRIEVLTGWLSMSPAPAPEDKLTYVSINSAEGEGLVKLYADKNLVRMIVAAGPAGQVLESHLLEV